VVAVAAELVNQSWRATGPVPAQAERASTPERNGTEPADQTPLPEQRGVSATTAEVDSRPGA